MKKTIKVCPRCGGRRFAVTAHVTQDWEVNEYGTFEKTLQECVETTHQPDDDDTWCCRVCGYDAAGSEFNVIVDDTDTAENHSEKKHVAILARIDVSQIQNITRTEDLNSAMGTIMTWFKANGINVASWSWVGGEF